MASFRSEFAVVALAALLSACCTTQQIYVSNYTFAPAAPPMPPATRPTGAAPSPTRSQSYPICYFNEKPKDEKLQASEDKLRTFMRTYLGKRSSISFSPNGLVVAATGRAGDHAALKAVWPRAGCIGDYVAPSQYVYYERCVKHLRYLVDAGLQVPARPTSDAGDEALYCDGRP